MKKLTLVMSMVVAALPAGAAISSAWSSGAVVVVENGDFE